MTLFNLSIKNNISEQLSNLERAASRQKTFLLDASLVPLLQRSKVEISLKIKYILPLPNDDSSTCASSGKIGSSAACRSNVG